MKCAYHPDVETNLRCGKCGKPICPRCMVQTPVGARCPDCARLYKLPTFRVTTRYYLRAAGAALGMAVITGIVWWLLQGFLQFLFLNLLLAAGAGYAIGEVVSLSVNRKRGPWLASIAGIGVVMSYLVNILLWGGFSFGLVYIALSIAALVLGIYIAATRLR